MESIYEQSKNSPFVYQWIMWAQQQAFLVQPTYNNQLSVPQNIVVEHVI